MLPQALPRRSWSELARRAKVPFPRLGICKHPSSPVMKTRPPLQNELPCLQTPTCGGGFLARWASRDRDLPGK
eukprot:3542076-Alexandrium_andersonii.AAC.1